MVCELKCTSLAKLPTAQYETVSYCWGDPSLRDTVKILGVTLDIPASSAQALRRVRLPDRLRVVWIDAICIDQASSEEKNQQVAMMGEIYRKGTGNLVYLGEETPNSNNIVAAVDYTYAEMMRTTNNFADPTYDFMSLFVTTPDSGPMAFPLGVHLQPLQDLYARDWFSCVRQISV